MERARTGAASDTRGSSQAQWLVLVAVVAFAGLPGLGGLGDGISASIRGDGGGGRALSAHRFAADLDGSTAGSPPGPATSSQSGRLTAWAKAVGHRARAGLDGRSASAHHRLPAATVADGAARRAGQVSGAGAVRGHTVALVDGAPDFEDIVSASRAARDAATAQASRDMVAQRYWAAPKVAFGRADNPIQMSLELEGTTKEIVLLYRRREVAEAEWQAMSLDERYARALDLASDRARPWEPGAFVRLDTAPPSLREVLVEEGGGRTWETTSASYTDTVEDLFELAKTLRTTLRSDGFHFHVTFEPDPRYARETANVLGHLDEFVTWRSFAAHPSNVHHKALGPHTDASLRRAEASFRDGPPINQKPYNVGLRSGIYGSPNRVGFEVRGALGLADNRALVEHAVRFLENPDDYWIRLGSGQALGLGAIEDAERIGSVAAMHGVGPDTRRFLKTIADGAEWVGDVRLERWSTPLVSWERRPFLATETGTIQAARARYVEGLSALEQQWESAERAIKANATVWANAVDHLVTEFAKQTGLHRFY